MEVETRKGQGMHQESCHILGRVAVVFAHLSDWQVFRTSSLRVYLSMKAR